MLEMEVFDPLEVMSEVHREARLLSPAHRFELNPAQNARISAEQGHDQAAHAHTGGQMPSSTRPRAAASRWG